MPLKRLLDELVTKVPGALGAILADWEGEMVDQVAHIDGYELQIIGAHKGIILNQVRRALRGLGGTAVREMVITTDRMQTLVVPVTSDYFLVILLDRGEILGRAMLEAKRCAARLHKEIG